jgi:hypothetical protein
MFWTEEHDKVLCGEIFLVVPFTGTRKGTLQRGIKWKLIAGNLNDLNYPVFKVDQRAVRDRHNLLTQRFRQKMREEEKARPN